MICSQCWLQFYHYCELQYLFCFEFNLLYLNSWHIKAGVSNILLFLTVKSNYYFCLYGFFLTQQEYHENIGLSYGIVVSYTFYLEKWNTICFLICVSIKMIWKIFLRDSISIRLHCPLICDKYVICYKLYQF